MHVFIGFYYFSCACAHFSGLCNFLGLLWNPFLLQKQPFLSKRPFCCDFAVITCKKVGQQCRKEFEHDTECVTCFSTSKAFVSESCAMYTTVCTSNSPYICVYHLYELKSAESLLYFAFFNAFFFPVQSLNCIKAPKAFFEFLL